MSSSLKFTRNFLADLSVELLVEVVPGGDLPSDIFIVLNTGTSELGEHQGVCSLEEYQRFQTFTGTPIAKFGNKYLKASQAKIHLASETEIDPAISEIVSSVKSLKLTLANSAQTVTVIDIP
jgi:hypothetical protein